MNAEMRIEKCLTEGCGGSVMIFKKPLPGMKTSCGKCGKEAQKGKLSLNERLEAQAAKKARTEALEKVADEQSQETLQRFERNE